MLTTTTTKSMETINLLVPDPLISINTKHRAILVVMNKDGTIHREKGSKKHLFHIGMLDGKYTVLCMRPGDASTYQFCGFAEKLPFAEAPEEIRKFILESGKFKNIDRVEVENLALYTYPCNDEGTAYWVRVGKVLPDEEGED